MLSAHYRSPLNFSADLMEASKNGLERIVTAVANLKHLSGATSVEEMTAEETELFAKTEEYVKAFESAMEDDFNTADAVSSVFELVKFANTTASGASSKAYLDGLRAVIVKLSDVLGLIVEKEEELLAEDIEAWIAERQAARKERNFQRADEIRNELLEKGIILEDTREGVKWKRT
jgi:cysteinyl-tRNA synthetase